MVSGAQSYSQTGLTIPAGQKGGWWGGRGPQMPGMLREVPPTLPPPTHVHRQRPSPLLMILFGREKASMNQVFISAQEVGGGRRQLALHDFMNSLLNALCVVEWRRSEGRPGRGSEPRQELSVGAPASGQRWVAGRGGPHGAWSPGLVLGTLSCSQAWADEGRPSR